MGGTRKLMSEGRIETRGEGAWNSRRIPRQDMGEPWKTSEQEDMIVRDFREDAGRGT